MLVEEALVQALISRPSLASLPIRPSVPDSDDVPPYVVYRQVAGQRVQSLSGDSGLANPRFQIDVYAEDLLTASTLAKEVREALFDEPLLGAVLVEDGTGFEPDTKLHRRRQDFSIWFND